MNISEVKELIAAADICNHVPLINGKHGIGKSESAAQYAKEQGLHFEPLILSLMDTGDMLGLPVTRSVGGVESTVWAAPSWYTNIVNAAWPNTLRIDRMQFADKDFHEKVAKTADKGIVSRYDLNTLYCEHYKLPDDRLQILRQDKVTYMDSRRSILFLDEFNRAPADILNASLQLILDHRLHSHILPRINGKETLIVAAINPSGDDYTVQEFDPALLDRFVSCEVEPDFNSWIKWANENNVNKIVVDFLLDNQRKFHFTPKDGSKGASPRSWTRLATYMDRLKDTNIDVMTYYIKGTIGSSLAAQFIAFYNSYSNSMNSKELEKLINKEIKAAAKNNVTSPEVIAETIAEHVQEMDAVKRAEFADTYVKKYIDKSTPEEAMVMLVYLYALPLESLSAVLKSIQSESLDNYAQLAALDKEANNKGLFTRLVLHLKGI